jgi:two-component system chemotaxis sensor kinase CheA
MLADDPALLAAFLDESRESLDGLESRLVELDCAADVRTEVDAIFRPVHTLKGNAPFFGFMEVQRLAHALETILDHLRKGRMARSQGVTDILLAGLDGLRGCIERIRAGEPEVADAQGFAALVERLVALGSGAPPTDPWGRVFADLADLERHEDRFDPDTLTRLARLRQDLTGLRGAPGVQSPAGGSSDPALALRQRLAKPLAAPLDATAAEAAMVDLRAVRALCSDQEQGKLLDDTLATCAVFLESVGFDDVLRQHILERLDQVTSYQSTTAPPANQPPARTSEPSSERRTRPESESLVKSMRVSEAAVDGFLAHVGELLVIGDQLDYLQRRLATGTVEQGLARDMRQAVGSFAILSSELQRSIMAVRRVPVRSMLQKAPRLVRDIAQATGKDIVVEIHGEMTEIDKGRLDLLDGPLTHLVRNCADHGIELPAAREAAGKPARGTITLKAGSANGWFTLEIADDGKGLDLDAIRRKGESLGLIRPGAALDERTIVDLIFASGLSTAATVSSVSGRGVGMDVVKRQIHEAGGTVAVTTEQGKGTTFSLRLPSAVSTQIIPAFLVRDGTSLFALPLEVVRESFVDAKIVNGSGIVMRHGMVLPVAPLGGVLGQDATTGAEDQRRTCVTMERNGSTVAVSVDETLGVHRLVIRPLRGCGEGDLDGRFQGAALLGDGRLALIVDPDHVLRLISREGLHA